LYKQFYGYAMSICLRYTRSRDEAKEILNDGFLKVFTKLDSFDAGRPFKTWLSRIMINTALDHYRQEVRRDVFVDVEVADQVSVDETVISKAFPRRAGRTDPAPDTGIPAGIQFIGH
jgi:RNA polymerase sigma factor (sigma-70 family)